MPGIPRVLLRLCRLCGKRGLSRETCQATGRRASSSQGEVTCRGGDCVSDDTTTTSATAATGSSATMAFPCERRPLACLEPDRDDMKLALILLNQPLESLREQLALLWRRSVLKAVADGGSNRLYECMVGHHQMYIPDIISGDFDSIRPEVLLYYQKRGAKIVKTPDQNYTDFTKCLRLVMDTIHTSVLKVDAVVVLGAFGDRFDQTLSNINTLFEANSLSRLPVYLISDRSLGCLLRPGKHSIEVNTGLEDVWCGLVPIGSKCHQVTTTGLKYNLDHQPLQFGGLISTSNAYAEGVKMVTVQTDQPLFWTMGFKDSPSSVND